MRTRTLLLPLVLAGGGLAAPAAAAQAPADSATYKHELGLTASPVLDRFFTANRALPLGLLYKRQLAPGRFLRLRLAGQYSRRDTVDYPGRQAGTFLGLLEGSGTRRWGVAAFVGHEWQRPIAKRLRGYYGAELGASQTVDKMRQAGYWQNQTGLLFQDGTYTTRRTQAQLRGFAGLQWQITPRVAVFTESAVTAAYEWRTYKLRVTGTQWYDNLPDYTSPAGGYADFRGRRLSVAWMPLQLVGLNVRF